MTVGMAALGIIEFSIYGFVGYGGFVLIMLTLLVTPQATRVWSAMRVVIIVPCLVCLSLLMGADGEITGLNTIENTITKTYDSAGNLNSTVNSTKTSNDRYILQDPVWGSVHLMMFLLLLIVSFIQLFNLFTQKS